MELFTFQDLLLFATFLITLLTYIDRKNKRRNRVPLAELLRRARSLATFSIRASAHPAERFLLKAKKCLPLYVAVEGRHFAYYSRG